MELQPNLSPSLTFSMLTVSFFLKLVEMIIEMDEVLIVIMHFFQAVSAVIAAAAGILLLRERIEKWRKKK